MNERSKEPLEPSNKKTRSEEAQNTCIFKDPISLKEPEVYKKNKKTRNNTKEIKTTEDIVNSDYFSFKIGEENIIQDSDVDSECCMGTVESEAEMEKFNPTDLEVVSMNESGEFVTEKQINKQDCEATNNEGVNEATNNEGVNEATNNEGVNEATNNAKLNEEVKGDQKFPGLIKNKEVIEFDKLPSKEQTEEINMSGEKQNVGEIEKENTNKSHEVETPDLPFYNTYLREPIFHEEEKEDGTSLFKNSPKNKKWSKKAKKIILFILMAILALLCIGIVIYKIVVKKNNEKK